VMHLFEEPMISLHGGKTVHWLWQGQSHNQHPCIVREITVIFKHPESSTRRMDTSWLYLFTHTFFIYPSHLNNNPLSPYHIPEDLNLQISSYW
jgi:hypothetical protein